ncbi:MAG: 4-hydroxy-tetrahydrodipicolinate reductase [Phycisphaerae bacterium]|nr:4-hydroxy-tetrahydrodipicolinate reductase [Phycisphaerae bacterium]
MSSTHPIRLLVNGATGRVGHRLIALACADPRFRVVAGVSRNRPTSGIAWTWAAPEDARRFAADTDVIVDFSSPMGAMHAAELTRECGAALLVGTTGLAIDQLDSLRVSTATRSAVLVAPNTSPGVAALAAVAADLARRLGPGYQASIMESHHAAKKDAPSGTALRLARAVRGAGGELTDANIVSVRSGDVVGEHTIRLAGPGEYLELTHRATTRDLFAHGALRAALALAGRAPGWYTIEDVLTAAT